MLGGQVGTRASGFPEVRGLGDGVGPVQLKRFGQAGAGGASGPHAWGEGLWLPRGTIETSALMDGCIF